MNLEQNYLSVAILVFIAVFVVVNWVKPAILYKRDGSLRQFGLGQKHKTIIPIWLATLLLAVFSYMAVLYAMALL
jgi:hypothetical protein